MGLVGLSKVRMAHKSSAAASRNNIKVDDYKLSSCTLHITKKSLENTSNLLSMNVSHLAAATTRL